MSLPRWWPRQSCVYCGAPTRERDPRDQRAPYHLLTCWRHVGLVANDPEYQ